MSAEGLPTISVCLPARNEAPTIGAIVAEAVRLNRVAEVVVLDDGSTDDTAAVATGSGARVVTEASVLPETGPGSGKGNAMWKSLYACRGDIICWIDADLRNFRGEYIERLCAPLLEQPGTMFVKAFFTRSFEGAPTGGGRVTELVARPLLSLLFPKLGDIVQPLGGEYAARRSALEVLPFVEGWGVELGLLVDVVERFGRDAVAQVDLDAREHRNRSLEELGPQALAVMTIALRRALLLPEATAAVVELLRALPDGTIHAEPVEVRERPPIITVPAYRDRFAPPR
ncbi:MAG: glucosyl-3-phosphoglycerate synthase [Actinomycetota bacterium]|nr:glucosyl-3-phosphoglycerate synthase [Actinomycetota bacterium]MDQ1475168.1 glucosyl-3-phosphoglycerate synthase [Actinomycetota bacterium]